ncbi:MAG: hypothetical protein U5K69_28920 [Balneolaceae bacterium]|nr:hypothetical protein [Balneolaceae bacterium]
MDLFATGIHNQPRAAIWKGRAGGCRKFQLPKGVAEFLEAIRMEVEQQVLVHKPDVPAGRKMDNAKVLLLDKGR